jgi:hypothetical protein
MFLSFTFHCRFGDPLPYSRHAMPIAPQQRHSPLLSPHFRHNGGGSPVSRRIFAHKSRPSVACLVLAAVHFGDNLANFRQPMPIKKDRF